MSKSVRQRFLGNEITSGFKALSPAELHRHTETAQRFLASAYDSVEELLITIAMFGSRPRTAAGGGRPQAGLEGCRESCNNLDRQQR